MLNDILLALIIALAFVIGEFLYLWAKEEIDWLKKRFYSEFLSKAKNIALAPVGILGLVQAAATITQHLELISLLILITALLFGSFVIAETDKKLATKYVAETVITFLAFFAVVYFVLNLELLI